MKVTKEHLDLTFYPNYLSTEVSFREYFHELLFTLWKEGEGFSGKCPLGNSGWEFELYAALIQHGLVDGALDEDGYVEHADYDAANKIVFDMIKLMCGVED